MDFFISSNHSAFKRKQASSTSKKITEFLFFIEKKTSRKKNDEPKLISRRRSPERVHPLCGPRCCQHHFLCSIFLDSSESYRPLGHSFCFSYLRSSLPHQSSLCRNYLLVRFMNLLLVNIIGKNFVIILFCSLFSLPSYQITLHL